MKRTTIALLFVMLIIKTPTVYSTLKDIPIYPAGTWNERLGYDNCNMSTNGEYTVVRKLIMPGDVVFDVGSNRGEWTSCVLQEMPTVNQIYAFEPIPSMFQLLKSRMIGRPVNAYNYAVTDKICTRDFLYYPQSEQYSEMSTFYTRPVIFDRLGIQPVSITVECTTLDLFCDKHGIKMIDFLKIDTEGSELAVLTGAQYLLKNRLIKRMQFEYGGTYPDAGITLKEVMSLLTHHGYVIFRVFDKGLIHIDTWKNSLENSCYSNYVAVRAEDASPYELMSNL